MRTSLEEDRGKGDITSESLFQGNEKVQGEFISKDGGIIAGLEVVELLFSIIGNRITFAGCIEDGDSAVPGMKIAAVQGNVKDILLGERLSLNILQRLSGIATRVKAYVKTVEGTGVIILDTRKTTPGMRMLEKYAVEIGGGVNHRMGLYDQVLIKDNHLAVLKKSGKTLDIKNVREKVGDAVKIEVEAECFDAVRELVENECTPDIIMLDNMSVGEMKRVAEYVKGSGKKVQLEASGGITLENARIVAETGVDSISIGEITHSVKALDIGFYL